MFWIFLLVIGSAVVLVKLGAYSIWVSVLAAALKAIAAIVIVGVCVVAWRHFAQRRAIPSRERQADDQAAGMRAKRLPGVAPPRL